MQFSPYGGNGTVFAPSDVVAKNRNFDRNYAKGCNYGLEGGAVLDLRGCIVFSVLRQRILLIPLAWVFSFIGLNYVWLAFPIAEIITAITGYVLYRKYPISRTA